MQHCSALLLLVAIATLGQALSPSHLPSSRPRRQSCECTPGESPKCGCQVIPSKEQNVQMVCSCSPPVEPKCFCKETKTNPPLPTHQELMAVASQYKCTDVCQQSCLEPCSMLQSNNKCIEVCSDACQFSCTKQETVKGSGMSSAKGSTISEYKFIIPSHAEHKLQRVITPHPPNAIVLTNAPPPPPPPPVIVHKTCEPACMPECTFACTTLKPALKMISEVMDGKSANPTECQRACGDTCLRVCRSSGVTVTECSTNCVPACSETCGFVAKKTSSPSPAALVVPRSVNQHCMSECMPSCTQQCIQTEILLSIMRESQGIGGGANIGMLAQPVAPAPAMIVEVTPPAMPTNPQIAARCQNECSVQCEHQCGVHTLAGPQCLAACQTTCYPVCQAKLRRKHMRARKGDNTTQQP